VQLVKNTAILSVAAATGATVAVSGGIGFIGIIVPHLLRLSVGPDHKYLLPNSALLGASMLLGQTLFCAQSLLRPSCPSALSPPRWGHLYSYGSCCAAAAL